MKRMRLAGWAVVAAFPQFFGCIIAPYPFRAEIKHDETVAFAGIKQVEVETRNGEIQIACDPNRTDVAVHATASARGLSVPDARQAAEKIQIEAKADAARPEVLHVAAAFPQGGQMGRSYGTSFRIEMPPSASLDLHTSNGALHVSGAAGAVRVHTSNGEIDVSDIGGEVSGRTSNGRVTAKGVKGDIDLTSSNGAMHMERVGQSHVKVQTSNGGVRIVEAQGTADVQTNNGSIYLQIKSLPEKPRVLASTSNGRIEVELPASVGARLEMNTSNGNVHADLDDVTVHDFKSRRSHLRAVLNDGGGEIELQSSNGSISLKTVGANKAAGEKTAAAVKP